MYSRITTNYINSSIMNNINNNRNILMNLQQQVSSQKKVNKPSDDPSAAVGILNTNAYLNKIDGFLTNVKTATSEANVSDTVLGNAITKLQRAKDLATQGATELNNGGEQRELIAKEIEEIMKGLSDFANTQYNSKYIYAGINSKTPAYSSQNGEYKYQGGNDPSDQNQRMIQIGEDMNVCVNPSSSSLFGEYYTDPADPTKKIATGPLGELGKLRDALMADPPDTDGVRNGIDKMEESVQHIMNYRTSLGNTMQTLDMMENKYTDMQISYKDQKSNLEDIDLLQASSDLTYQEAVLQASLNVGQRMMQPSLLNYM